MRNVRESLKKRPLLVDGRSGQPRVGDAGR